MAGVGRGQQSVPVVASDAKVLAEVVTRLRRALRASIRTEYPWESRPMAQIEMLLALQANEPMRVGEIANRLRLAPNTVSGLVQTLVESGLVQRSPDPYDRRAAVAAITPLGEVELQEWVRAHESRIGSALERLSAADQKAVRGALVALERLVEELGKQPDVVAPGP